MQEVQEGRLFQWMELDEVDLEDKLLTYRFGVWEFKGGAWKVRCIDKLNVVELRSLEVRAAVKQANLRGDWEMATLYSVARLFMLKVPLEALPFDLDGHHSKIEVDGHKVHVILFSRKNSRKPSVLTRTCVCRNEGLLLCGVCAIKAVLNKKKTIGRSFNVSYHSFLKYLRRDLELGGVPNAKLVGFTRVSKRNGTGHR